MTKIFSASLDRSIEVSRIIGQIRGSGQGPTIIFFGGVHGNESSGVFALNEVLNELQHKSDVVKGNIFAICGNMDALKEGLRFTGEDLNRIWTSERIDHLSQNSEDQLSKESKQQQEIYSAVQNILTTEKGPFYFIDLHTTSSESIPFVVISDSLINRKFAEQFPVPLIVGIEEYVEGALLSYINELGYVSLGYEAGRHEDMASYENQIAFIYLSLSYAGIIAKKKIDFYHYFEQLAKTSITSRDVYEIVYRYKIRESDDFEMKRGFVNFQKVKKNQVLATRNGKKVIASHTGRLFMPLYQNQGTDGFFEIRKIHPLLLRISELLRYTKADHLLPLLPGIRWQSDRRDALIVNLKVARFFTKQFLHLLGYRSKRIDKRHLVIRNVETNSRTKEYRKTKWGKRK